MTNEELSQAIQDTRDMLHRTVPDIKAFRDLTEHLTALLRIQIRRAEKEL